MNSLILLKPVAKPVLAALRYCKASATLGGSVTFWGPVTGKLADWADETANNGGSPHATR